MKREPDKAIPHLLDALEDPTGAVRQLAQFHLNRLDPDRDLAEHYRRLLSERASAGAVRGLAEMGAKKDWEQVFPLLDAQPKLAQAALRAMCRLNDSESRETRLMMVDSPSPGVTREAASTLNGAIWTEDEATLHQYLRSPRLHVRRAAAALVLRLPRWTAARNLLALRDEELRPSVQRFYWQWLSHQRSHCAAPDPDDARVIRELAATSPLISESQRARTLELLDFIGQFSH